MKYQQPEPASEGFGPAEAIIGFIILVVVVALILSYIL